MAEELKACDCGSTDSSIGYESPQCYWVECGDCGYKTANESRRSLAIYAWNTRAQPHSQVGEAVEVVAYIDDGGALYTSKLLEIMSVESDGCEPLMAVAQHQRILAASVGSAEPVAYAAFADNGNIRMWCRSAIGMCELFDAHGNKAVPLYAHPADQVAQPDAELVELLREARELIEHGDFREGHCMCGSAVEAHGFGDGHSPVDAGVYYAGQVMERIDAKMATLK